MNPNKAQLYEKVAQALVNKPSEQPVAKGNDKPIEQNKANDKSGFANQKFKQKGNPNKQYSVSEIQKALGKTIG